MKTTYRLVGAVLVLALAAPHACTWNYYCNNGCTYIPYYPRTNFVYCSPVFHMPLQPAPSPSDGGYYFVCPNGSLQGPNYCLRPPFNPVEGFNGALIAQELFLKKFKEAQVPKQGQQQGKGPNLGSNNSDYSNAQSLPYFQPNPMPGGGIPGGGMPPGYGPPGGFPGPNPGQQMPQHFPQPERHSDMIAQAPVMRQPGVGAGIHPASFQHASWYGGILSVQGYAPAMPSLPNPGYSMPQPNMPAPGYAMAPVWQPHYGWTPSYGYAPGYGWTAPHAGYNMGQVAMPNPGYAMNAPVPMPYAGYNAGHSMPPVNFPVPAYMPNPMYNPSLPMPSYTPNLPNVGYAPPNPPPSTASYPSHALVRSPRDFFMWIEDQEDQKMRRGKALMVP